MLLRKSILPHRQDLLQFTLTVLLIPMFYYLEVFVILPALYPEWNFIYMVHVTASVFLLHNITGNMLGGMLVNTSIQGRLMPTNQSSNWRFCAICEAIAPPRSWHCSICNICILKRDHHCSFFGCCVGHLNQRYFFMFVFHIFLAMIYALVFNAYYIYLFLNWDSYYIFLNFIFPLAALVYETSQQSLYTFVFVINVIVVLFTGFLCGFHGKLILEGKVTPENKGDSKQYNFGWKRNIVDVFGKRWFLVWVSPLLSSELTHDGIMWNESHKDI